MTQVYLFLLFLSLLAGSASEIAPNTSSIAEIIAHANATSEYQYGDIRVDPQRSADPCTSGDCKWPKSGACVRVPYYIYHRSNYYKWLIRRTMQTFHLQTCIRFQPWNYDQSYLLIYSGNGCWSYLGRQSGPQLLSLQSWGCLRTGTVQHELLHALGFHHEQNRSDRDTYVRILYQNIQRGRERNFQKVETNNLGTPYDYDSVMHYPKYAFSKNRRPTILAKRPPFRFGLATAVSEIDIRRVNRLYRCCDRYKCCE